VRVIWFNALTRIEDFFACAVNTGDAAKIPNEPKRPRRVTFMLIVVAPEIALAAIAAALAFLAEVIGTGIFGAVDTNVGGGFVTNVALESEDLGHGSGSHFAGCAAGLGGAGLGAAG
jgi:hypothetical protein